MPDHQACFVEPDSGSGSRSSILQKAFDALTSRDVNPKWLTVKQALNITEADKFSIYIMDPFEGRAFEHLESIKCRIYGPSCVLSCTEAEKPLPKQQYPLYSLSMRGLLVCFSSIENQERERLMSLVRFMGGEVMKVLTEHVTHLVTKQVGSKKYIVATSNLKIPIMLPDWVDRSYEASRLGKIHAANDDFKKFICPVFSGISVSVSGLDQEERKRVQAALEENGGSYSGEMRRDSTTHLITTEPKGQKYNFACKWKIYIVHPQWLHDSLHNGYSQDESLYSLDSNKTSTPTKNEERLPSMNNVSSIMSNSMMNVSAVNETAGNSMIFNNNNTSNERDVLEELELKSSDVLDGCKVYLSGFCGERLDKVRKFVSLASGTRLSLISDDVTHVIVNGKVEESLIEDVKRCSCQPHVVSLQWLVESQKKGRLQPEDLFSCLKLPDNNNFSPVVKRLQTKFTKADDSVADQIDDNEMTNLLSQYMTNPSETKESTLNVTVDNDVTRLDDDVTRLDDDVTRLDDESTLIEDGKVLGGKKFLILGFEVEVENEIVEMIQELGGHVVESKERLVPHYALVPPLGHRVTVCVDDVVTSVWLQHCYRDGQLPDLNSDPLYRPLVVSQQKPLDSCRLAITGFTGFERDCLLQLAEKLGAIGQEYFCKKSSSKAQATTHLLASVPDGLQGSKYETALQKKVPVVTKEWLLMCAETGERPNESEFDPVSAKEPEEQVMAPPKPPEKTPKFKEKTAKEASIQETKSSPSRRKSGNLRVLELQRSTPKEKPCKDVSNMTPNTALANIELDVSDMLHEFDTPASQKKHRRKSSLPLEELYNHHINIALRRFEHPEEFQSPSDEKLSQDSEEEKPLKGVIVAVSKKLTDKQSEYFNIVSSLGGDYRWSLDPSCTHYIFQGKSDSSKEYKMAKDKVKYIISPYWLMMCEQQNSRVDEGLFPANFNPSMSLCVTTPRPTPVTRRQARLAQDTDVTASPALRPRHNKNLVEKPVEEKAVSCEEKTVKTAKENDEKPAEKTESGSLEMQQAIQKELEDIMANTKPSSCSRRKPRRTESSNRSGRMTRTRSRVEDEEACSQQAEVTWDDPNSRIEREKFNHVLHKPYSPTQQADTQCSEVTDFTDKFIPPPRSPHSREDPPPTPEPPTPEPPSLIFPRPKPSLTAQSPQPLDPPSVSDDVIEPKFLMSGMNQQEKDSYGALIESLGGTLLEANTFDIKCTHLIAGQPTRNEKCLASVASGKWILHKSYLEACRAAGTFVKEDDHEWGSLATLAVKNPPAVVKLAEAAHRWRVKLQRKHHGAFHDWRVIICTPKNKVGGFKRLLEAGGARVLSVRPPFTQYLSEASHAFMDLSKMDLSVDLNEFARAGVPCYKPEFIAGFLMEEFLDKESYLITDMNTNLKKRKSSGSGTETSKKSKLT